MQSIDGLLTAGDASGFIDPMTGDGLGFATRGAELAAAAALRALEHGWSGIHARLNRERRDLFRGKWRFNRAMRALVASPSAIDATAAAVPSGAWAAACGDRLCRRLSSRPRLMIAALFAIVFGTMIGEAIRASRNERVQFRRGGVEPPDDVYRAMRVMYPGVFLAMFGERLIGSSSPPLPVAVAGAMVFAGAKALKWWAIATLGRAWTFRVIVVPGTPLVVRGPYRWLRHPNYVGVVGELVGVAAMLGASITGPLGLVAFSGLLIKRIAVENRTLSEAAR